MAAATTAVERRLRTTASMSTSPSPSTSMGSSAGANAGGYARLESSSALAPAGRGVRGSASTDEARRKASARERYGVSA